MQKENENNVVKITGKMVSEFNFNHDFFGEKFYTADVSVARLSGTEDIIPVMVSDRLVDMSCEWAGQIIRVSGQFRSFNKHGENGNKLILVVFAKEFEVKDSFEFERKDGENSIFLDGFICKEPIYRKTPRGRDIADLLIAVNRPYGKTDYIPCIVWGRNAIFAGNFEVGERISIEGRIQSREYPKKIGEDEFETRTAYEVSASMLTYLVDNNAEM